MNPRPRRNAKERHKLLQDKLERAEALLHAAGLTTAGLDEPESQTQTQTQALAVNSTSNFDVPEGVRGHSRSEGGSFSSPYPRMVQIPTRNYEADTAMRHSSHPPLARVSEDSAADPSFLPSPLESYTSHAYSRQSGMGELGPEGPSPRPSEVPPNSNPNQPQRDRADSMGGARTYDSESASAEHRGHFTDNRSVTNVASNPQLQSPAITSPDSGESVSHHLLLLTRLPSS